MQIGIVSDTHGYADPAFTELFREVSCIIHAGDIGTPEVLEALAAIAPVHAVRGNVDRDPRLLILPEQLQLNLDGLRLLVVHRLQDAHPEPDTQVVVSGHSHRAVVEERHRILYLNPGAAGRQGFHRERTAGLLLAEDPPVARLLSLGPKSRERQAFAARPERTPGANKEKSTLTSANTGEEAEAAQKWPKITMYTTSWCPDCRASKRFLTKNGVPFTELDIEAKPETADIVRKINNGKQRVPTIVIEGGPTLVEPSDRELGQALGVA